MTMRMGLCWLLLAMVTGGLASAHADYAADVQAGLRELVRRLPETTQAATRVAPALAEGGQAYLAGDRGFIAEGLGRAGGMMTIKALGSPGELKAGDVVLLGLLGEPSATERQLIAQARTAGAHMVIMGPESGQSWGGHYLALAARTAGQDGLPTVTPLLIAELWTFTGELVAALTRLGKMPPMYQSILVPGGTERNAEHLKYTWEPQTPAPVPPMVLGRTYLARISNYLRTFTVTQREGLAQTARLAAETKRAGGTVWFACLGHLPPEIPAQPGDPGLLEPLLSLAPERLPERVQPGDLVIYIGYYEPYGPWVEQTHAAGARIVTIVAGTPQRSAYAMGADLNLSGCWPFGDTTVEIPGYDVRLLPPSGFMQAVQYFMVNEALAAAGA